MLEQGRRENARTVKDLKLSTLLELTNAINNNLPEDQLFILFEFILKNQLNIGRAVIFLNQDHVWQIKLQYGVRKEDLMINIEHELKKVMDITVLNTGRNDKHKSFDVVIPIFHQSKPLAYLLLGDLDEDARKASPIIKHLAFIQTLANITSVAVENKRLEKEHLEQERLKQELRLASQMQEMLLPKVLPDTHRMKVSAFYKPHQEVGGDFYDVLHLSDNETVICIADVSGKGISAAILMANFQANLRANLKVENNLVNVIHNLNETVWDNAMGERYITCFLAKYKHKERVLEFVNAAHPGAILIKGKENTTLESGCVGIGMFEEVPEVKTSSIKIAPGTLLLCFTDGITETENEAHQQFQEAEMNQVFDEVKDMDTNNVNMHIMARLDAFKGPMPYRDDLALISCRFL